jgi:hypothetical protein
VQAGDRLLLCGNYHALHQASAWIAPTPAPSVLSIPLTPLTVVEELPPR